MTRRAGSAPLSNRSRPRRRPTGAAALAAGVALVIGAAGCAGQADEVTARGTGPGSTLDGTTMPPATSVGTTEVPTTTEPPTTTTEPPTTTTVAPTTAAPTTAAPTTRPPRPSPPKAGRPAPPEALALPGPAAVEYEGQWEPIGPPVGGAPAMYRTSFRSNGNGSVQAGIVWIDNTAVRAQLFPGTGQPGGAFSVPFNVPVEQKPDLLAAFNSGFLLAESQGGFYLDGREAIPLRDGSASVYIDIDGGMNVGALGRDFQVGPTTASIRQNLPLLVDGGVVAGSATDRDNYVWGKTLGGGANVWRSGLGQRADGTLVYVGGPAMSARMLGNTLVAAGAERAMELDINPNWVTFNWFTFDGQSHGTKLLPSMLRDPNRYLTPDNRDFFALFARPGA